MQRAYLSRLAHFVAAVLLVLVAAAVARPAAAKTMIYVPESPASEYQSTWYAVLNSDGKARLVGNLGAKAGTYTDNGTEILVTLTKPFSSQWVSAELVDCPPWGGIQYQYRHDVEQVLFRRIGGTNVNKGKSQVVEIGHDTILDTCKAGQVTPFGSVSDPGYPMVHLSSGKREPMTDVTAGLTIAGFREPPLPGPYFYSGLSVEADVVTLDTDTTVHFQRSGHVVNATMTSDQWLVLDLAGFQRGYTRVSVNTSNGIETWLEAAFKDGKPQAVTYLLMTKPLPGATFGTKAATSRMWENIFRLGTDYPFFYYLYRDFTGDRVSKDLAAATESRTPITWKYEGLDVLTSYTTSSGELRERRWMPLGRTGKYMSVMEQEVRTPAGGSPYLGLVPRVFFYVDRGAAYPPAP